MELFDRQGLIVEAQRGNEAMWQLPKVVFRVVRPSGQVSLKYYHVKELQEALGRWLEHEEGDTNR